MSATWIVGDIHGCAEELAELIDGLQLGPEDRLISVGDLYHRGPDPLGVARLLVAAGAEIVLGNHEHVLLRKLQLLGPNGDWGRL
ncbi:MAG: metallophosphoesterase, partial [Planctomycetes bacterium]|nr:metallophosphoesterase [Planctomycetota bacterium]